MSRFAKTNIERQRTLFRIGMLALINFPFNESWEYGLTA
jgi:hypothetical protein